MKDTLCADDVLPISSGLLARELRVREGFQCDQVFAMIVGDPRDLPPEGSKYKTQQAVEVTATKAAHLFGLPKNLFGPRSAYTAVESLLRTQQPEIRDLSECPAQRGTLRSGGQTRLALPAADLT